MAIKQQTPPDAHKTLKSTPGAIYLDVRTEAEFAAGHPEGAINVPVLFMSGGQRKMNADFVDIVEKIIPRETTLVVGCMAGGRSQHACELLEEAGYNNLTNVEGGFGGARDQSGNVIVAGWKDAGLPVSNDLGEAAYDAIKKKAGF
ncbi:MAG TPA: rhodanese-like domain-containing protein [Candidatus Binataceae bacterium]|nr:rhodanese-like domain-containing protein [Candidatus Binataceae bacterium]